MIRSPRCTTTDSRPAALAPRLLAAGLLLASAACGGGGEDASQGIAGRPGAPADSPAPPPGGERPADAPAEGPAGGDMAEGGDAADSAGALPDWTDGPWQGRGTGSGVARQLAARTGRHEEFDRLVLVFANRVPGYTVRYFEEPPRQCGSGRVVEVAAPRTLEISLEPARAHNEAGHPTVQERSIQPRLPMVRSARLICDFEGHVDWVVSLEERTPLRIFTLDSPARLVIDFRR